MEKILTKKSLSHINKGRVRTEESSHGRRGMEDDGMDDISKDLVEEEDNGG